MPKTQKEIIDRIENYKDFFGFTKEALIGFLDAENAKQFFAPEEDLSGWEIYSQDADVIISQMRDYMDFAWEKVLDERGVSAIRSIKKFQAWLWLLDDQELLDFLEDGGNFSMYGKPILAKICEKYEFGIPKAAYPLDKAIEYSRQSHE